MATTETTELPGLRERKKAQTRRRIAETARDLFVERGFERVTVAEIADAAEVSQKTVFNYFPTKEDIFYWQFQSFEEEMLDAIRTRGPGEPILEAFRRFLLSRRGLLGKHDPDSRERLIAINRMIRASPALLTREEQVMAGYATSLAELIAHDTRARPGDIRPRVAAHALMGVHRSLIDYTRNRIAAGELTPRLSRDVTAQAKHAFALLEDGLGAYGIREAEAKRSASKTRRSSASATD
jgi:AcrR family transcriptional regulator